MARSWPRARRPWLGAAVLLGLLALVARGDGQGFHFFGPASRLLTPNGIYQSVVFCFDNPADSGVGGKIYTLLGSEVASLSDRQPVAPPAGGVCPGGLKPQFMYWDGRQNGALVHSGVYIYQIRAEGRSYTGTVVVAR